jgi:hypothetical protein
MTTKRIAKPPVLAEMRLVPIEELKQYRKGSELARAMLGLKLACFSDQRGSYWFGVADPSFPEHDRWFYRVGFEELETARNSWADTEFYTVERCCTRMEWLDQTGGDFVYELQELKSLIADQLDALSKPSEDEAEQAARLRLRHNALLTFQAFGYLGLEAEVIKAGWGADLHDLLRHPTRWRAANPEFNDVPEELVLRMHGLKRYADNLAQGINWLV